MIGALLLGATAAIHLKLFLDGYRSIPTIGWLFLLNAIVAAAAAVAMLVTPGRWLGWTCLAGGLLEAGTLGALILSLTVGLFGFTESPQAPLMPTTVAVETAGAVVLLGFGAYSVRREFRVRR